MKIYRKSIGLLLIISSLTIVNAQPLQNRVLIATSQDGLNFQKSNIIFCDSADVPDAVIGPSGSVYVFYQGLITPWIDGIKMAISSNGVNNWQYHQVIIPGTGNWPGKPCDPDVIVKGDTFRLYFTGDTINDGTPETYSAISIDGINFIRENGVRFEVPNNPVLDPSLLWTGETLQYFAGGAPQGFNWHAHSTNGLTFIQQPNFYVNNLMMANGISINSGGYRFYGFSNNPNQPGIRSIYSIDGRNWTLDSGIRLQVDSLSLLEYLYVKDPAIVYKDSIHIMYYVTRKRTSAVEQFFIGSDIEPMKITPNPSRNIITTISPLLKNPDARLKIYNSLGKVIKEVRLSGRQESSIEISENGIFFVVLDVNGKKITNKVIITN